MVSISSVAIANMALSHIGAKNSIESFDEKSAEAKQCKVWYAYSIQQALESYDWSFARRRTDLALSTQAAPPEWLYRYQYPADCAKARLIYNPCGLQADAIPFDIEIDDNDTRTILTNMNLAQLVYTKSLTTTGSFTTFFVELASRGLAQHIAFKLTGSMKIADAQAQVYQNLLRSAPAQDANEHVDEPPREAEWIRARGSSYYPYRWR